ncbi:MAG: HAD-IIIC family phosphatase, partial [Clostridium sp.]|nr:HAD-IIIC family phosphatase [Clostridium sp.]
MKLAILSNVNVDIISQFLSANFTVFPPQGYGNSLALLYDPLSDLNRFAPDAVYYLMYMTEFTAGCCGDEDSYARIDQWFIQFEGCMKTDVIYFVSDAVIDSFRLYDDDEMVDWKIQSYWNQKLAGLIAAHENAHAFALSAVAKDLGKNFFSTKLWYLGKIPFSTTATQKIADEIVAQVSIRNRPIRKVLVLDLDNTLWGGILGEDGLSGILLSDDGLGAVYRDCQRLVKQMQLRGVLLALCSKNNEADALEVLTKHPHMILRKDDFVSIQVNWNNKPENIKEIARELNLGLDSFVFVDDSATEREAVKTLLPEVAVPDFPDQTENLPAFYRLIFTTYFRKWCGTQEDLEKTRQYQQNASRTQLEKSLDYDAFLRSLALKMHLVSPEGAAMTRMEQLLHKTNQFNLTTKRYALQQLEEQKQAGWKQYLFHAGDQFGDYGIIAAV